MYNSYVFDETDFGYRMIIETNGLDDVEVTNKGNWLYVKGENDFYGHSIKVNKKYFIDNSILNRIIEINYFVKNGFTIIEMKVDKRQNTLTINKR